MQNIIVIMMLRPDPINVPNTSGVFLYKQHHGSRTLPPNVTKNSLDMPPKMHAMGGFIATGQHDSSEGQTGDPLANSYCSTVTVRVTLKHFNVCISCMPSFLYVCPCPTSLVGATAPPPIWSPPKSLIYLCVH
jgi:hypothetical protein